ncbi:MAG: isoprenylcysteine carboxylmethyltransferase family protein [Spirochaetes bacterium]|nr:isoprenylcysteine carboxylmethyltransferase family protein [Spirochaetota bacterium]
MRCLLIALLIVFYLFFFVRAFLISRKLGKNIKGKNPAVNLSVLFAGLSSALFFVHLAFPKIKEYFYVFSTPPIFRMIGVVLVAAGLVVSMIASLTLKNSWRIGIDDSEKTELITSGIYRFSRNPYFISFNFVLIGMLFYFPTPVLMATVLITVVLFHVLIVKEEKYLTEKHGDRYLKYKNGVKRYIPFFI